MSKRGLFITFEGGEGCGKSTQIGLLAKLLEDRGLTVVVMREPGGTQVGERVREVLLDPALGEMTIETELLLYQASRAQLVAERIVPDLAAGRVVLCDRFADSTLAYQGFGRGLSLEEISTLSAFATSGLTPDLTFVLDLDPDVGLVRAIKNGADRLEAEHIAFHRRVQEGFRTIAASEPSRVALIDASGTIEDVHDRVLAAVRRLPVINMLLTGRPR